MVTILGEPITKWLNEDVIEITKHEICFFSLYFLFFKLHCYENEIPQSAAALYPPYTKDIRLYWSWTSKHWWLLHIWNLTDMSIDQQHTLVFSFLAACFFSVPSKIHWCFSEDILTCLRSTLPKTFNNGYGLNTVAVPCSIY